MWCSEGNRCDPNFSTNLRKRRSIPYLAGRSRGSVPYGGRHGLRYVFLDVRLARFMLVGIAARMLSMFIRERCELRLRSIGLHRLSREDAWVVFALSF